MKTHERRRQATGPKLPPPPDQVEDWHVGIGFPSPRREAKGRRGAEEWLAPLLLRDDEPSGLPPDPPEPPPLPDSPPQSTDDEFRGAEPEQTEDR